MEKTSIKLPLLLALFMVASLLPLTLMAQISVGPNKKQLFMTGQLCMFHDDCKANSVYSTNFCINEISGSQTGHCAGFDSILAFWSYPSYIWKGIMAVQGVLKEGCRRVVGSGADTVIGTDPWLPDDNNPYVETELHQSVIGARVTSLLNDQGLLIAGLGIGIRRGCILLSRATSGLPWLPRMIGHGHGYGVCMFPLRLVAESAFHLFVDCVEARRVWNLLGVPQLNAYTSDNVSDWFFWCVGKLCADSLPRFVMVCWGLWTSRNDSVWKGSVYSSAMVVQRALDFLEGWRGANKEHRVNGPVDVDRWKKPPLGRLKLNTDVSVRQEEGWMGLGWVLRDDSGGFLAAKNVLVAGAYLVKEAEALCVREALSWLKGTGLGGVDVEMDSQLVCNAIHSVSFGSSFGILVDDVKDLASQIEDVKFNFVKRSANRAAHCVSREAFSESGCGEWLDSPPSFLVNILHSDIMN